MRFFKRRNKISQTAKSGYLIMLCCIYEVNPEDENWYKLNLYANDKTEKPATGTIQIVDAHRIRIYFWKHHDILDEADEFYRADDLFSFQKIMDQILN